MSIIFFLNFAKNKKERLTHREVGLSFCWLFTENRRRSEAASTCPYVIHKSTYRTASRVSSITMVVMVGGTTANRQWCPTEVTSRLCHGGRCRSRRRCGCWGGNWCWHRSRNRCRCWGCYRCSSWCRSGCSSCYRCCFWLSGSCRLTLSKTLINILRRRTGCACPLPIFIPCGSILFFCLPFSCCNHSEFGRTLLTGRRRTGSLTACRRHFFICNICNGCNYIAFATAIKCHQDQKCTNTKNKIENFFMCHFMIPPS